MIGCFAPQNNPYFQCPAWVATNSSWAAICGFRKSSLTALIPIWPRQPVDFSTPTWTKQKKWQPHQPLITWHVGSITQVLAQNISDSAFIDCSRNSVATTTGCRNTELAGIEVHSFVQIAGIRSMPFCSLKMCRIQWIFAIWFGGPIPVVWLEPRMK